jgi:hypothetical protein
MAGGEQLFTDWSKNIIDEVTGSKVSLVFIVMSKLDRMDAIT